MGDTIVEIGCGTRANFPALEHAIGPTGAIIGVDLTAEMLEQARERVRRERWSNVTARASRSSRSTAWASLPALHTAGRVVRPGSDMDSPRHVGLCLHTPVLMSDIGQLQRRFLQSGASLVIGGTLLSYAV